jgi:predicted amidohydrolase
MLNYSKVFICDFGKEELLKPNPNVHDIGCDVNCSPGELFDVCTLIGAKGQVKVGAMVCADREFPEAASQLMLNGAELIVVPNACTWDDIRTAGLKTLIARAGEHEEILLATFDVDEIRQFRSTESWRMDYRRGRATKFTRDGA